MSAVLSNLRALFDKEGHYFLIYEQKLIVFACFV